MLEKRLEKLRNSLPEGTEALLIETAVNMFYFLDFDAHGAGTLLLLADGFHYIIDSRYIENANKYVKNAEVILQDDLYAQLSALLEKAGVKKLYTESKINVSTLENHKKKIPNVEIEANNTISEVIEAQRVTKDGEEIRRMKEAQRISDECFSHILPFIKEGVREIDMMLEMEHYMRSHGAEKVAFDTIFVAGANSSLPHGVPGNYRVKAGDFITMDFGAKYMGYCSDMTRTLCLGKAGSEQKRVYETVLNAHSSAMAAVKSGVKGRDIDKIARDIIDNAGYRGKFGHGLGHAVGIEIHESPRFSPKSDEIIMAGTVITVEPGIYLEGEFGCRIEDTILVTENGYEDFAVSNKELIEL